MSVDQQASLIQNFRSLLRTCCKVYGGFKAKSTEKHISLKVEMLNAMVEKIVKMSKKGQLVVPSDIREKEELKNSDRFIALPVKDGVVFKKIKLNLEKEYEALSKEVKKRFKEKGLEEGEAGEAVEWARKKQ